MLDILRNLVGSAPAGLEFLEYIFSFVLVMFGIFVVAYIAHLPFEFVSNLFHNKKR